MGTATNHVTTAWVTGAGGLIGSYAVKALQALAPGANIRGLTRADLDLADSQAVRNAFNHDQPELIVHCAALSRSPDCEAHPQRARQLNVEVTALLAELAARDKFVFFSSDQVFDGRSGPYVESSPPNPTSIYAQTKAEAEEIVLSNPGHLVIRTSLNGGTSPTGDRGFNEQMRVAWAQGKELTLFIDEFRCPIHAEVTARAVCELALKGCSGIYHVAGTERLSRYDLGILLARRWPQLNPKIRSASLTEYKGPPRAPDLELDCTKAGKELNTPLPGLTDWLNANAQVEF